MWNKKKNVSLQRIINNMIMTALVLKRESDNYWNLIKDASNEVKLALIKRLSDALRPAVAEKKAKKKIHGRRLRWHLG